VALFACQPRSFTRGELEIAIDCDVPLPTQASDAKAALTTVRIDRLRVDVYDGNGEKWLDTRDFSVADASLWPVTFGVHSDPDDEPRKLRLRVRAYPASRLEDAYQRDAQGKLVLDAGGAPIPLLDPFGRKSQQPRTAFAIDRVVLARIEPGAKKRVSVDLLGDCMGIAADLASGSSCIKSREEPVIEPVPESEGEELVPLPPSKIGSWARARGATCAGTARPDGGLFDQEACVPSGVFHLGDDRSVGAPCDPKDPCAGYPERLVFVSSFYIDRFPVTVARLRAAMLDPQKPFTGPEPVLFGDPKYPGSSSQCTWTGKDPKSTPGYNYNPADDGRPVNCITRAAARAFCQHLGGDLPTEAQWEYVATAVSRPFKTLYPWGDSAPACDGVIFGRAPNTVGGGASTDCVKAGFTAGIARVDAGLAAMVPDLSASPSSSGRVAHLGGLLGNVLRDAFLPYDAPCWKAAARLDPECADGSATRHVARGGSYLRHPFQLMSAVRGRLSSNAFSIEIGFRCARAANPKGS
jgi:hypothetical protein